MLKCPTVSTPLTAQVADVARHRQCRQRLGEEVGPRGAATDDATRSLGAHLSARSSTVHVGTTHPRSDSAKGRNPAPSRGSNRDEKGSAHGIKEDEGFN